MARTERAGSGTRSRARTIGRRAAALGALAAVLVGLLTGPVQADPAPQLRVAARQQVQPLFHRRALPDPSVVPYAGGFVALATGSRVPRATARHPSGPWRVHPRALVKLPRWARSPDIWASDMVRVRQHWLIYFSAPVRGLGAGGRCIGVARSARPLGAFRSVGRRPLICPRRARAPRAYDGLRNRGRRMPRTGVIDPSGFRGHGGRRYLLYKTQGFPSSIRLVRLTSGGAKVPRHARSRQLVRARGTVENPVLVRRHRHFVLFTSEGFYGRCDYRTTWRRSRSLTHWKHARAHVLLRRSGLGVCGPGGADVVTRKHGRSLVFFHGWTCHSGRRACPRQFHIGHSHIGHSHMGRGRTAQRSLYAAHLRWAHGAPRVRRFLRAR